MNCPYCGRPYEEGLRVCPHCHRILSPPADVESPGPTSALPLSSGPARAGLILGLLALLLLILSLVMTVVAVIQVGNALQERDPRVLEQAYLDPEAFAALMNRDPALRQAVETGGTVVLIGLGLFLLAELGALLGLVLGVIGLAQEKVAPTRQGRTHSIIGIVVGAFPLFCCLGLLILFFAGLAAR
ncbi:MAG: hypothetical protein ACP5OO_01385 [Chloroflexia bacterium]